MGVGMRDVLFLGVVLGGVVFTGAGLLRPSKSVSSPVTETKALKADLRPIAAGLDAAFRGRWTESQIQPAARRPSWP